MYLTDPTKKNTKQKKKLNRRKKTKRNQEVEKSNNLDSCRGVLFALSPPSSPLSLSFCLCLCLCVVCLVWSVNYLINFYIWPYKLICLTRLLLFMITQFEFIGQICDLFLGIHIADKNGSSTRDEITSLLLHFTARHFTSDQITSTSHLSIVSNCV